MDNGALSHSGHTPQVENPLFLTSRTISLRASKDTQENLERMPAQLCRDLARGVDIRGASVANWSTEIARAGIDSPEYLFSPEKRLSSFTYLFAGLILPEDMCLSENQFLAFLIMNPFVLVRVQRGRSSNYISFRNYTTENNCSQFKK